MQHHHPTGAACMPSRPVRISHVHYELLLQHARLMPTLSRVCTLQEDFAEELHNSMRMWLAGETDVEIKQGTLRMTKYGVVEDKN